MSDFVTYNATTSGVDITPVLAGKPIGTMQMISYRLDREKVPIHTMGSPDARAIARGKRTCMGSCVFTVFDREALFDIMDEMGRSDVWLGKHETANYRRGGTYKHINNGQYQDAIPEAARNAIYGSTDPKANNGIRGGGTLNPEYGKLDLNTSQGIRSGLRDLTKARLADQILPFDIVLASTNEFGSSAKMTIYGVEFVSESGGVSIDDLTTEKQYSFIARSVSPWEPMDTFNSR